MKFPSIKNLASDALSTIKRFPLELFFALTGTVAVIVNIELDDINRLAETWCIRIVAVANLGLLLSLAATLFAESKQWTGLKKMQIRAVAGMLAVLLLFVLNPVARQADSFRFFLLSIAFHMLVAYAAFLGKDSIQGFWQFNKTLFLRFLAGALYSLVLGAGISAAIGAVNYLFGVDFEFDTYKILWTCIAGIFSVMFFLTGVPADTASLNNDYAYPKGLKVFTQYVLIPLATIYLLILLMYDGKILVEWNLPKGNVAYLVLGYSIFGILSLLLVYPVREQAENKWLKTYTRSFYFLLMPLLVLLWVAVGARVIKYGVTEFRYILILLAVWLLFISVYFLFFKKQNIKLIPVSLSILALLASYGPQSAFSISESSQRRELVNIFKRNNAFKDGHFEVIKKISKKDGSRAVAVMQYLVDKHDMSSLQPYFKTDLNAISDSLSKQKSEYGPGYVIERHELRRNKLEWLQKQTGLINYSPYGEAYEVKVSEQYWFGARENVVNVQNYDFIVFAIPTDTTYKVYKGVSFKNEAPETYMDMQQFKLTVNGQQAVFNMDIIAAKVLKSLKKEQYKIAKGSAYNYEVPADSLVFHKQLNGFLVSFAVSSISFEYTDHKASSVNVSQGVYLVKKLK